MNIFGGNWETQFTTQHGSQFIPNWRCQLYLKDMTGGFVQPDGSVARIVQGQYTSGIGPWGNMYGILLEEGRLWRGRWWGHPWKYVTVSPGTDSFWWLAPNLGMPVDADNLGIAAIDLGGEFWFRLSEDGSTFTGAYNLFNDPRHILYAWDGYKVCEQESCTQPLGNHTFPRESPAVVVIP
jgi:hypothetical protein